MVRNPEVIYLDINGTLVFRGALAPHAEEFLDSVVFHYECRFLSARCQGNTDSAIEYLLRHGFPAESAWKLKRILPTSWEVRKTEAIDFSRAFLWVDDHITEDDIRYLSSRGAKESFARVNFAENPDRLLEIMKELS